MTDAQPLAPYLDYFEKLRALDRKGALETVRKFLEERPGDVEGLYVEVLMPALVHTGKEWEQDRISVAHEHYISEVTRDLIRQHGPSLWVESTDRALVAVAGCAPGDRHTIGLMMVCDVLKAAGVEVHSLGEGISAEDVTRIVVGVGADLLCLSCALDIHLEAASDLIEMARAERPDLVVLVGGAAFGGSTKRAQAVGADHFACDARDVRRVLPMVAAARGRAK